MPNCLVCGTETKNPSYCSRSCSAKHTNSLHPRRKKIRKSAVCRECGKEFEYGKWQTGRIYCSNACQGNHRKFSLIEAWESGLDAGMLVNGRLRAGIRNHLIAKSENQCSECGWNKVNPATGKCPLEVDHIDGNAENCRPENLRILCPNCHSLTPTWKALNSGNGSKRRLKYGKLI